MPLTMGNKTQTTHGQYGVKLDDLFNRPFSIDQTRVPTTPAALQLERAENLKQEKSARINYRAKNPYAMPKRKTAPEATPDKP